MSKAACGGRGQAVKWKTLVKGDLDAPAQSRLGTGNAQVTEGLAQKAQHLIAPGMLDRLIETGGVSIVYLHLGQQHESSWFPLTPESVVALEKLAARSCTGQIHATTVSRLLRYVQMRSNLRWTAKVAGSGNGHAATTIVPVVELAGAAKAGKADGKDAEFEQY